ncbi:MAG: NUDIX domain-containing protein [Tissierellia bacterium]|nr:NUDIX domain-containing protein [Tissierellia bacterium]
MEIRDIYDAKGQKKGYTKDRSLGLLRDEYIMVAGVIVISRGQVLLTQRALTKTFPGEWEFTMGSAQAGEAPIQTARRELKEEVGIQVEEEDLEYLGYLCFAQRHQYIYLLERDIDEISLQEEEVIDYRFVDFDNFQRMLEENMAAPMKKRLEYFMEIIKKRLGA